MELRELITLRRTRTAGWPSVLLFLVAALLPGAIVILPLIWWLLRRTRRAARHINLPANQVFAAALPLGTAIHVTAGTVWATTSGNVEDVWLFSGDMHRVPRGGLTVIEAPDRQAAFELRF